MDAWESVSEIQAIKEKHTNAEDILSGATGSATMQTCASVYSCMYNAIC